FPLSMIARKVAPALAAGCTIVLKPSSKAPQSAIEMAKIFEKVGLPSGVFNIVMAKSSEVTDVLMNSRAVRKITFTGSTRVGKLLMEKSAKTVKRISMELGGHAPFIVFDDADIEIAASDVLDTKFRCTGQMCTSTNRIFVHQTVAEKFSKVLTEKVKNLSVGNGMDESVSVGPVIDKAAVEKIQIQIDTYIKDNELLSLPNHENYRPAAYMYSNNIYRVHRMTENLEYGMIGVNNPLPFVVQSPLGGVKESGVGKEGGHQGIEGYLVE